MTRTATGAAASLRSANESTEADAASSHCTSSTAISNAAPLRSPRSWKTARRDRPLSWRRPLDLFQQQSRRKRTALRPRQPPQPLRHLRTQEIGEGGKREGRLGSRRTAREDGKTMRPRLHHRCVEERRLPIPASPSSTSPWGVDRPAARKSASTATSTSRPQTRPCSRPSPLLARRTPTSNPNACEIRILARRHSWMLRRRPEADNGRTRRLRALILPDIIPNRVFCYPVTIWIQYTDRYLRRYSAKLSADEFGNCFEVILVPNWCPTA